ncbi:phage major capsid protein, partial [Ruminococcus sp.]|uniref:phage major capsid protein n=1 Tax=Ruminococcus sp. TaxID=41978 RepID=UPI0025D2BBF0
MYDTIKLEKSMYNLTGKSFSQALEELDPSAAYADSPLGKLDAFERQLKRFDIHLSGPGCDRVEKFFTTTESAVLFPEFIRRAILSGMRDSILTELVAVETKTTAPSYTPFTINDGASGFSTTTSEGGTLPATAITLADSTVSMTKFGRLITASYEVIRQQKLDVFAVTLRSIGMRLANAVTRQALDTLYADTTPAGLADASAGFGYEDLAALYGEFTDYDLTTVITTPELLSRILAMSQMENQRQTKQGELLLPFGAKLVKSAQL